ncbi:MAG: response regulator transcription factor [Clostridiales bacterium]|nr:response regulator transcription factor [Clostridiales bacterium]
MPTFLTIEDDKQIRKFISFSLRSQGYDCLEAATGQEGMQAISMQAPDVIVLDLGLPDMDGMEIIRQVREFSSVPIIVVSARDQDSEKVAALDAGADDYLTKPFSVKELLARIRVVLRHSRTPETAGEPCYRIGEFCLNHARREVTLAGAPVHFTPMEYQVLHTLVKNAGKVMTHNQILQEVWGRNYLDSDTQTLRVFMANIRRKLEKNPAAPRYILTEIGIGYRFAEE